MSHKVMQLGDIFEFVYGKGLTEAERNGGEVPVYGSNGIVGWHNKSITMGTTIIIGRKGSLGEVHISSKPCWPIDTTYYVVDTKIPCDLSWLYYALLTLDLTKMNKSAAVPGLNRNDAYEKRIHFPLFPEQRRIAAILVKADRLRRLRQHARQLGETYLQSVFLEMFGDGRKFMLAEFADILAEDPKNGLYLPVEYFGSGMPIIRIDAFYDGILDNPSQFKRVRATPKQIKEFSVENDEILINRVNSLEYLGKCALVRGLTEPTLFESNMMRIRLNREIAHPIFVTKFLTSPQTYSEILQRAKKAVNQASINQEDVEAFKIPVPSLADQERFAVIVNSYEHLHYRQREAECQAEMLFQGLLHRAFQGEL